MIKKILFAFCFLSIGIVNAQENLWSKQDQTKTVKVEFELPLNYEVFQLNQQALVQALENAPNWTIVPANESSVIISIPNADGKLEKYSISEASVMAPELQARFPEIRSYIGQGVDDTTATLRMSYSPQEGFDGMIRSAGKKSMFFTKSENNNDYAFYKRERSSTLKCSSPELVDTQSIAGRSGIAAETRDANSGQLSTFRLALTCNGEYGAWAGGTTAAVLSKFNATLTRVNGIYEQELAIHLNLVNNTNIIYLNAATDPYTAYDNTTSSYVNSEIQNTLDSVVGNSAYDIGHFFGQGGSGGHSGFLPAVCITGRKGSAYTSRPVPEGDAFDIDYVAHEMGHQFGGNHTWTSYFDGSPGGANASVPGNEGQNANLEPGSGSTIMAYAGITGSNASGISTDVQGNSDDYFHFYSIQQITNYIATTNCQTTTALTQATPTANAGANYTIPLNTPFVLTGSGTSGGTTTYCWEENDLGGYSQETTLPTPTSTSGPSFRSILPTTSPKRYFPSYQTVLNGTLTDGAIGSKWELLNLVGRTYNFKLTVRDNVSGGAQNVTDTSIITVSGIAGPFKVTSQNASGVSWNQGETQTITWDVAGTTANGINTANVNILLSTDNGATFTTTLATNTPNDGSQVITVPNVASPYCRIKIEPTNSIYYSINSAAFAIGYTVTTTCTTYTSNPNSAIPDGAGANTAGNPVTDVINVPLTGAISDLNLTVNISHLYIQDLVVQLNHPDGTTRQPWQRDCAGEDNFNITFDDEAGSNVVCTDNATGTYKPKTGQELSIYNTKPSNGDYTLLVADFYNGDTGDLNSWSLEICETTETLKAEEIEFSSFTISPNPNNGNFTLELSTLENEITVKIYDASGRLILDNSFDNTQSIFRKGIHLNNVKSGVYLVQVSDKKHFRTERIIVK